MLTALFHKLKPAPLYLAPLVIIILSACSKSGTDEQNSKSPLLTSGEWRKSAHTVFPALDGNGDGVAETDIFSTMAACVKDDGYVFEETGVFRYKLNIKCSAELEAAPSTWILLDNETKLNFWGDTYSLVSLEEGRMVLSYTQTITGTTYTHNMTFTQ